ncbi:MAG TPA: hypothetical protein VFS19_07585 [Planctomycetota bacterium]|nr:hypothetical protein [Planctomycetota bacterium]
MSRMSTGAAVLAIAVAAGCAGVDERHAEQMMLGQQYYMNEKFYEAIGRFEAAAEHASSSREKYQATLGVANASTEYGLRIYQYAEDLLRDKKFAPGKAKWQEADKWHDNAARAFYKCLEMRPDDKIANIGLASLFFRRATSFSILPYLETEEGRALRRKERDEAVRQYQIVLGDERGDITKPEHGPDCKGAHFHRYLALALFTRSDWDRNDGQEARRHMIVYLNFLKWASRSVEEGMKAVDDAEKIEKEKKMDQFRKQIAETRFLLGDQLKGLREMQEFWKTEGAFRARLRHVEELHARSVGKEGHKDLATELEKLRADEKKFPPKEKREAWTLAARREISALEVLAKEFEEAAQAARKKAKPSTPETPEKMGS